ncbi:MAG: OmpA family protein [Marinilabiliaceae bacterium]
MRLTVFLFFAILFTSISTTEAQIFDIFGPKRSNINMELSDWKIMLGDTVTLKWDVTINRSNLKVALNDSVVDRQGSIRICPDKSVFYRIEAETKSGNSVRRTKKIKVLKPAITSFLTDDAVRFGKSTEVKWRTENSETVRLNGQKVDQNGDSTFVVKQDTPVTIQAENPYGKTTSQTDTIKANYQYLFHVGDHQSRKEAMIAGGMPVTLHWQLDDVSQVRLQGHQEELPSKGSLTDTIRKDTLYALSAKKHDGTMYRDTLKIKKAPVSVRRLIITNTHMARNLPNKHYSDPIRKYHPYVLSWKITGVREVFINGEEHRPAGTIKDQALDPKDYSLVYEYYDQEGNKKKDSIQTQLEIRERPFFNGNVRENKLHEDEMVHMEVVSVNYDNYPPETTLKVVVVDDNGDFVSGLADPENKGNNLFKRIIEKYENKKRAIRNFQVKEHKLDEDGPDAQNLMMTLDYSGSMAPYIREMKRLIRKQISLKHPDDTLSFLKFDHTLTKTPLPQSDGDSLLNMFNQESYAGLGGGTALYAATDSALNASTVWNTMDKMILFTDGYENSSYAYRGKLKTHAVEVIKKARELDIPIYVVSLGGYVNKFVLDYLADYTGGHYYQLFDSENISRAFTEVFRSNENYYTITYNANNKYEFEKEITLIYDNNETGLDFTSKKATKKDDFVKIAEKDLPPLHQDIKRALRKEGLTPVSAPQNIVNFSFDKHRVKETYTHDIDQYTDIFKDDEEMQAIIIGHTDMKGDSAYCMGLSKRRARAVKEKLIEKGVSEERISTMGLGQEDPIWEDDTEPSKAMENRRVEILFAK